LGGVASLLLGERVEEAYVKANVIPEGVNGTTGSFVGIDNNNQVWDNYGVITGGLNNTAGTNDGNPSTSPYATVGGGYGNSASGNIATVGGGDSNKASGIGAFVGGGGADGTTVSGNVAGGNAATIGGGLGNAASGKYATVGGGDNNTASLDKATVGGGDGNAASGYWATVGGGCSNMASGEEATVGGGGGNQASNNDATVGGGSNNRATGPGAVVGGGGYDGTTFAGNHAGGNTATIGGGLSNSANGGYATVGGGSSNMASGLDATVPGGFSNLAAGDYSFAAGNRAKVGTTPHTHNGTFLFADSSNFDFNSAGGDEFAARATGGVRFVTGIDGSGNPLAANTFVMTNTGNLGVGTAAPHSHLFVVDSTTNPSRGVVASQNNSGPQAALMQMTKSRGTASVPGAVVNGDYIAAFNMNAYDGTNYLSGKPMAGWGARVNGAVATGSIPADLFFYTKPSGTLDPYGDGVVRVVISSAGNVGIGTTSPSHLIQLSGGAYSDGSTWVNASDRSLKENFTPLDENEILNRLESVPIQKWNYKNEPQANHIGSVAQDFYAAYQLGDSDKSIGTIDADGIAFAAIKALHKTMKELRTENEKLQARLQDENEKLQERIAILERTVKQFAAS
jgi:hypothetical protein